MSEGKIIATHEAKRKTVKVEFEENGIAWVFFNRPEKRNAMSPALNDDMVDVLDMLETDDRCKVLVLTGAGEAWTAGMDLREFFRALDKETPAEQARQRKSSEVWQFRQLRNYPKPTIAMVNGWCFGGAFTPLACCDLAVAADEAIFGVSEINWGILPGGVVTKALQVMMTNREARWYILTGETFNGKDAARMGVVNRSYPSVVLKDETRKLCEIVLKKGPATYYQCKVAFNYVDSMDWDMANEWLRARSMTLRMTDKENIRDRALTSFLDKKEYRPGLGMFDRDAK
jgi:trans-feruloyl-CoA hydratase/vanillin synthase